MVMIFSQNSLKNAFKFNNIPFHIAQCAMHIRISWNPFTHSSHFLWNYKLKMVFDSISVIGWFIILVMYSLYNSLKEPFDASNMECRYYNAAWEKTHENTIYLKLFFSCSHWNRYGCTIVLVNGKQKLDDPNVTHPTIKISFLFPIGHVN